MEVQQRDKPRTLREVLDYCREIRNIYDDGEDDEPTRAFARSNIKYIWADLRRLNLDPFPVEPENPDRRAAVLAIDDLLRWARDKMPAAKPRRKKQSLSKISVDLKTWTITIDGDRIQLDSEMQARWLNVLSDNRGQLISGPQLVNFDPELDNPRTDKLKNRLPAKVRQWLGVRDKKGTRMKLALDDVD